MKQTLHFLPWLRRGLGLTLTNPDLGSGALARGAPITAQVRIDADVAEATLSLRPIDHATGIDTTQIVRRQPAPYSVDAEYGYFPSVDIVAPDLPWVLTPAAPADETARLRPWLALVCVEDGVADLVAASQGRPARLVIPADRIPDQLPDLAESYAWAHVQSAVELDTVVTSLTDTPGAVIARLVCPRRLVADTTYRLAIVAAFKADGDDVVPAWDVGAVGDDPAELVVFDTWTMATGQAGSFEELCERLGPVDDPTLVLGLHTTDVTELGPVDPWPPGTERVTVDFAGAMWDADVDPDDLGRLTDDFADAVAELLDLSDLHPELDLDEPDPIVTPPFVGSYPAEAKSVPNRGWLRELNLDPANRAAAGLGAQIVRIHQERFMAMAWQQVGQLRETNRQLSITRLQAEIGRTWKDRADRLDPHERVAVMRPQLSFVRDDDGSAPRRSLAASTFPNALTSPAYLRVSRPGGVVATAAARRNPEGYAWHASLADAFGADAARELIAFAEVDAPDGTRFDDSRGDLDGETAPPDDGPPDDGPPDDPDDPDGPLPTIGRQRVRATSSVASEPFDLRATARLISDRIAPILTGRARIEARIPALVAALEDAPRDELPTRVAVGPVIDEALVWSLVELSPEVVLPGVDQFPNNAVRVVETNPAFVAAFLAGANHEMARELLWREFPADMGATTFRRFWDRPDVADVDIDPMIDWTRGKHLAELGSSGGKTIVVLIRGDLVRHYPTLRVFLVDPATHIASLPTFGGWIPPDVRFMAFDVDDADAVTGSGSRWRIVLEEQPSEPRFGLDTIADGDDLPALDSWNELSWQHLAGQDGSHLVIAGALPNDTTIDGTTWGLNAAHMASATYQAPFRFSFGVLELIGGSS